MRKWLFAVFALTAVLMVGCASQQTTASSGGLPEIAPYDDAAYDALPDMVAAE
jgi:uncharacterized lipoprotein YmbA